MNWKRLGKAFITPPAAAAAFIGTGWGIATLIGTYPLIMLYALGVVVWGAFSIACYYTWFRGPSTWRP